MEEEDDIEELSAESFEESEEYGSEYDDEEEEK